MDFIMLSITSQYNQRQTGNISDKWHLYLNKYDQLFMPYRNLIVSLLEIGIQNGGSLDVWANYFQSASVIIGCDINPACAALRFASNKIKLVIGDIQHPSTQQTILTLAPSLDIVIDDGSHTSSDIIQTFCALFGHVKDGGLYVIEDLHCSYWLDYGGGLYHPHSSYAFFKALIDICNQEHWGLNTYPTQFLESLGFKVGNAAEHFSHIHAIEFLNSMCIIHKQTPSQNQLGRRSVSGQVESICAIKHFNGQIAQAPDQSHNPYSVPLGDDSQTTTLRQQIIEQSQFISALQQQQSQLKTEILRAESQLELLKDLWLGDL
jgi:hypothetical protein